MLACCKLYVSEGRSAAALRAVERAEETARRQAEAAQAVRAEDYLLALLRRRRNLPLRREMDPHVIPSETSPRSPPPWPPTSATGSEVNQSPPSLVLVPLYLPLPAAC